MFTTVASAEQDHLSAFDLPMSVLSAPKGWKLADNFERILTVIEVAADFASLFFAVVFTYLLARVYGHSSTFSAAQTLGIGVSFATLFVLMLDRQGGYRSGNSLLRVKET